MANLVENSKWEDAVYQLETSDPVVGGPDGIDNLQPRQLANRTRYLKDQQEAHAAAANPHPQYAKTDSPAFTGSPQVPQASLFDVSTRAASTSFVQRALGNFANVQVVNGVDTVLNASAFGCAVQFGGASCTATLPSGNGANAGSAIHFYAQGGAGQTFTIKAPAGGFIYTPGAGFGPSNTSITLGPNDTVVLVNRSGAEWDVVNGTWVLTNEAIAFNGKQSSVTPPQFDASTRLATTAFVQRALGSYSGFIGIDSSTSLSAAQSGFMIQGYGTVPITATLPAAGDVLIGTCITFFNAGAANFVVASKGDDFIFLGASGQAKSVVMQPRDSLVMLSRGYGEWDLVGGTAALQFSPTLGVSAPQFDSSAKLATTDWVNSRGMAPSRMLAYSASQTLTASQAGSIVYLTGAGGFVIKLPLCKSVGSMGGFILENLSTGLVTVAAQGGDGLEFGEESIAPGGSIWIVSDGSGYWHRVFHSNMLNPNFAGQPTATTPQQFDNGKNLATTGFVQRALGNFQGFNAYTSSQTLTAAQSGSVINFWGGSASTFTLPACSAMPFGGSFLFNNSGSAPVTVTCAGQDSILCNGNNSSVVVNPNDNLLLVAIPTNQWIATGGSAQLKYASVMSGANFTTAPQFDSSKRLATTEFVQRALGNTSGIVALNANTTITAAQAGQAIQWYGAAGGVLTLPAGSSMANGGTFTFLNFGTGPITVTTQGDDFIWCAGKVQPVTLQVGDSLVVVSRGVTEWNVVGGSAAIQFAQTRGVTASQFDNSPKLATTNFVQRALGNMRSGARLQTAGAIPASSVGGSFTLEVTNGAFVLPALASVAPGAVIEVLVTVANVSISRAGSDGILLGSNTVSSLVMNNGETAKFVAFDSFWVVISGSVSLRANYGDFGSQLAQNGFQKLSSGLMLQWGNVSVPANSAQTIAFPLAFQNTCVALACASDDTAANGTNYRWTVGGKTRTSLTAVNNWNGPISGSWMAYGY